MHRPQVARPSRSRPQIFDKHQFIQSLTWPELTQFASAQRGTVQPSSAQLSSGQLNSDRDGERVRPQQHFAGHDKLRHVPQPKTLGTAPPLSNSGIITTKRLYIARNRISNIDCSWVRAVPNPKPLNLKPLTLSSALSLLPRDGLHLPTRLV